MRKVLYFFIYSLILLLPLSFSNANAGYGSGELKLSDNVIYSFQRYIQQRQPMRFLVTEDGKNSTWWYCPEAQCEADGTCGSGKSSIGPIYREKKQYADTLRNDDMNRTIPAVYGNVDLSPVILLTDSSKDTNLCQASPCATMDKFTCSMSCM